MPETKDFLKYWNKQTKPKILKEQTAKRNLELGKNEGNTEGKQTTNGVQEHSYIKKSNQSV